MENNYLQKLIHKYLNEDCTPEEIKAVHQWYDSFDGEQNPMDSLSTEQQNQLQQRLINRIRTNITLHDVKSKQPSGKNAISRTLIYSLSGIAATVVLVIGFFLFRTSNSESSTVSQLIQVVNKTKSIQKVVLEDGSIVWLNPKSIINYPAKFSADHRDIHMIGEAFFEVTPDKKRPFSILSENVITKVWGTSFRIRAYKNVPVEVSVVTGKVSVRLQQHNGSEIMLLPNQKATYLKENNRLQKESEKKTSTMRIWKRATMSFDNAPLSNVIHALNNKFGVHIYSTDEELLNYVLRADFTDQSLPSILEMLEKSLDLKYEISDRKIILSSNNQP